MVESGAWETASGLTHAFTGVTARYVQFALRLVSSGTVAPSVSSVALTYGTISQPHSAADVTKALRIAAGLDVATAADKARLAITGGPSITVADAVAIDRKINGK